MLDEDVNSSVIQLVLEARLAKEMQVKNRPMVEDPNSQKIHPLNVCVHSEKNLYLGF